MYSPPHYRLEDINQIYQIIREYSFATLIVETSEGIVMSHLPFVLNESSVPSLSAHMARGNPQWKRIETARNVTIIFQGPHGYISPQWYQPDPENVPTWNYVAVHVTGKFQIVTDSDAALEEMKKMISYFEAANKTQWNLIEPVTYEIENLLKGIVVFQISDLKFEGKFKLSQNQNPQNRNEVIRQLQSKGDEASVSLASIMESSTLLSLP